MSDPITRQEEYLASMAGQNTPVPDYPITREEAYLNEIIQNMPVANPDKEPTENLNKLQIGDEVYAVEGGGGGGTNDYSELIHKPSINDVTLSGNKSLADLGIVNNVQANWNQTTSTSGDYIKNKPTLGTAAAKDVPATGDASSTEVVLGSDTRLTDSRNAKDVYLWAKAANKPTYNASEVGAIATTAKGANGGVAELDSNGKVPSAQLPSYVDDVLEYNNLASFPATGETGKIYVAKDTNKTYRWSGTAYVEISESLALGETSSTAYAGDKGKANADAITAIKDGTSIDSFSDVESALSGKQDSLSWDSDYLVI